MGIVVSRGNIYDDNAEGMEDPAYSIKSTTTVGRDYGPDTGGETRRRGIAMGLGFRGEPIT